MLNTESQFNSIANELNNALFFHCNTVAVTLCDGNYWISIPVSKFKELEPDFALIEDCLEEHFSPSKHQGFINGQLVVFEDKPSRMVYLGRLAYYVEALKINEANGTPLTPEVSYSWKGLIDDLNNGQFTDVLGYFLVNAVPNTFSYVLAVLSNPYKQPEHLYSAINTMLQWLPNVPQEILERLDEVLVKNGFEGLTNGQILH